MGPLRVSALAGLAVSLLGGPAVAQPVPAVRCTAFALAAPVYADGITEPVADIAITCDSDSSASVPTGSAVRLSVEVSLNASVTNTLGPPPQEDFSDAVLVVHGNDCPSPSSRGSTYGSCGAPSSIVQDPQFGRLTSIGTLEWADVTIPHPAVAPAGTPKAVPTIRIRGIRTNASQLRLADGTGRAALPVTASISLRSGSAVALQNGMLHVAYPTPAVEVDWVSRVSRTAHSGDGGAIASIHVREGFPSALRSDSAADGATPPSRVLLEFGGIPDGVALSVPLAVGCHQPDFDGTDPELADTLVLGLVTGNEADGSGGAATQGAAPSDPGVPVDITEGTGRAVYEVEAQDPALLEDCHIPIRFDMPSDRTSGLQAWVSAGLAPRGSAAAARAGEPVPRFSAPPRAARAAIDLAAYSTTLLFPFVTNQAGFTTGLVITHGSRQALTGSPEGAAGSCDLHYYGEISEESDVLLVQHSTQIDPGDQLVFTLSGGNPDRNILGTEQFQGYMMALCGFPDARGYAFISDGFGGIADLAMGYLARVVSLGPNGKRVVIARDPQ